MVPKPVAFTPPDLTPLLVASFWGNLDVVNLLIEQGSNLEAEGSDGECVRLGRVRSGGAGQWW